MENKRLYGIEYKNLNISVEVFERLSRLLYLSQSNSVADVQTFLIKAGTLEDENLSEYLDFLEAETEFLRSSADELESAKSDLVEKLQMWIDNFNPTPEEINEYVSFYNLSYDLVGTLRLVSQDKILSPKSIFSELDKYIVGQDNAKKILSTAVYTHLLRRKKIKPQITAAQNQSYDDVPLLPNPNIILIGSTGTGKSYILKTIAKVFGLPFLKVDCASLTSSGYIGNGLNEYISAFYKKHKANIEEINNAIFFFDEFDKLSENAFGRTEGSVGGVEMQQEFLHLIEDKEYLIYNRGNKDEGVLVNLSNCMFVFGGSFYGIDNFIEKRLGKQKSIGFKNPIQTETDNSLLLQKVVQEDLVKFGILPELVGRVNHIVTLQNHTKETIIEIIKNSSDSILKAYFNYFEIHLDKLIIEDDVYELIAERVMKTGTGARALNGILNELLKDLVYESPNMLVETFTIDKDYFNKVFNY